MIVATVHQRLICTICTNIKYHRMSQLHPSILYSVWLRRFCPRPDMWRVRPMVTSTSKVAMQGRASPQVFTSRALHPLLVCSIAQLPPAQPLSPFLLSRLVAISISPPSASRWLWLCSTCRSREPFPLLSQHPAFASTTTARVHPLHIAPSAIRSCATVDACSWGI
jgi:hypothetical protein